MPLIRYKSLLPVYKVVSWFIEHLPLPEWVTVRNKYGILILPKSFRIITTALDLVEPEVKKFIESALRNADVFIDVGAAYGYYTLKASRLMKDGIIVAFEPDPLMFKILEANLAINSVYNVKVINAALSDMDGEIDLGYRVKALRLDTFIQNEGLELTENSLSKDRCGRNGAESTHGWN
ncbi:MAG: FkbM family methyltransferase [Crenarchaeota archaeon]|nr:FkbM family methyltransferase [Thermoproteota archaeon]